MKILGLILTATLLLPGAAIAGPGCGDGDHRAQISCPAGTSWNDDSRACQPIESS